MLNDITTNISNYLVAFGTLTLAVITFITTLQSKKELNVLSEDLEITRLNSIKSQILERIWFIFLKFIKELNLEIEIINKNDYCWMYDEKDFDILNTPIPSDKIFYTLEQDDTHFMIKTLLYDINQEFPNFEKLTQNRYSHYLEIESDLLKLKNFMDSKEILSKIEEALKKEYKTQEFKSQIEEDFYENDDWIFIPIYEYEEDDTGEIHSHQSDLKKYRIGEVIRIIKNISFFLLFDNDPIAFPIILNPLYSETNTIIREITKFVKNSEFSCIKDQIDHNLNAIKNIDEELIQEINKEILRYREIYKLNSYDIWKNK